MSQCINHVNKHHQHTFSSYSHYSPCYCFQVQYKKEYEKTKAQSDYNTLPATENPLLRQLRYAGTILSDVGV